MQFSTRSRFIFSCRDSQSESERLRALTYRPTRPYLFNIENDTTYLRLDLPLSRVASTIVFPLQAKNEE